MDDDARRGCKFYFNNVKNLAFFILMQGNTSNIDLGVVKSTNEEI